MSVFPLNGRLQPLWALLAVFSMAAGACATDDPAARPTGGTLEAFCAGAAGQTGCCVGSRLVWCESGQAVAIECGENQCGWWAPGGYYDCYASDAGPNRECPASDDSVCQPTCTGRCGISDGCGGTCGCPSSQTCQNTICVKDTQPTACEKLMHVGCCDGDVRRYCQDGQETSETCTNGCGWNPAGWYDCGHSGSDPSGVWGLACSG